MDSRSGRKEKNSNQLWVIAVTLIVIAVMMLFVVASCAGLCTLAVLQEDQRRQEIIKREPWRRYQPNNGF